MVQDVLSFAVTVNKFMDISIGSMNIDLRLTYTRQHSRQHCYLLPMLGNMLEETSKVT
jgi:hypothetical protein